VGRNRTGIDGFAGRCMTILPPRHPRQLKPRSPAGGPPGLQVAKRGSEASRGARKVRPWQAGYSIRVDGTENPPERLGRGGSTARGHDSLTHLPARHSEPPDCSRRRPAGSRSGLPTVAGAIYPLRYKAIQFSCERRSRTGYKDRAGAPNARAGIAWWPGASGGDRKSASIFNLAVRRVS
jgi:hypothetical protein